MTPPTIIAGPALVGIGSYVYYTEGDVIVALSRKTWKPQSSAYGPLGSRHQSQMFEITFTPVGMLDTPAKYRPYAPANVGNLLFDNTPCYIQSLTTGQRVAYPNAAVTGLSTLRASPIAPLCSSPMKITSLGDAAKDLDDDAAWNTLADHDFDDTSYDESKILSPRYTGALGNLDSPWDEIQPLDGFYFEPLLELNWIEVANFGTVNALIKDVGERCRFTPVGMDTQDYYDVLAELEGAGAVLPGDPLGKNGRDLVVSVDGGAPRFSLTSVGAQSAKTAYSLQVLRTGEIAYEASKTFSSGRPLPLLTMAFS